MATPNNEKEKFTEKLLKEWEKIETEVLIREVATKGQYINLLQQYLSKRNGKPLIEIKHYFNDEIDKYVRRLLSNRQVHKAELVLKNVGRKPQAVFYEFVQTTSHEHIDDDIKEHVLEHLQNSNDNFEMIRDEWDYYLIVLRLVATNKSLRREFEEEIHIFTLEALLRKNEGYRKLMAVTTCLQCKNASLVEKLDKRVVWRYLWKAEQFQYVSKWLNLLYANKLNEDNDDASIKGSSFDLTLRNQFASWEIEADMFDDVQTRPKMNEMLLNCFAQNGMIVNRESNSIVRIFQRIFTTESLSINSNWLFNEENLVKILQMIFEENELVLLLQKTFQTQIIERIAANYQHFKDDVNLCSALKDQELTTRKSISWISEECSKYIIKTSDEDFYPKLPHVYILEKLLKDVPLMHLAICKKTTSVVGQISVLDLFCRKLRSTKTTADYDVTLNDLLKLKNLNPMTAIQSEVFISIDNQNNSNLISFSDVNLNQKYGQMTFLNYIDYVKQHRSSYAVYKFFIDQLNNYSQISRAQIQIAGGTVCELALNNIDDGELIAHGVAFLEMLGINSQILRAYVDCCRIIESHLMRNFNIKSFSNHKDVVQQMENILLKEIRNRSSSDDIFDPQKFESLRILCRAMGVDLPISFLREVAFKSNWYRFLLFATYHNYSIRSIVDVCQMDCFDNHHIGLNIGRALKEIIVEDEMPKRSNSFSFREHKRKIQSKIDASHLLNVNHKPMSNSTNLVEKLPVTKLLSSHLFLNINDDMDIFAVILICTCETKLNHEPTFNLKNLRGIIRAPDTHQPSTYLNLIRYAFKMKWPILTVLAATVHKPITGFCWIIWLMISIELSSIPNEFQTFDELIQYTIKYAVQQNYVRTLHQSFEIFYPSSKFTLFTKFLSHTSRYNFTSETSTLLMDFFYELDEGTVSMNDLVQWSDEDMLLFITTLLIEYVKTSFDSIEHCQQLLDTICASGIGKHIDSINFCTVADISRIVRFTNVRLNIDEMIRQMPAIENDPLNANDDEEMTQKYLQNEYIRIYDELVAEKAFTSAINLANLLALSKDSVLFEQWIHLFGIDDNFDLDECDRGIAQHQISPLVLINFLLYVSEKLIYADVKKYFVLKKVLNAIKTHHLYPNDDIQRDRVEYDMYKCLLKSETRIDEIEMYNSEYFETIMMAERGVLYKSFHDLKDLAGVDQLTVVAREELLKHESERLDQLMNHLLEQGDIVQALRLQGIFNHRTMDLHYLVFCMALAENLASLYDLSAEQKQMLNDGLKQAASKFNRRTLRLKRLNSCSTSTSSSPVSKTYFDSVEPIRVEFEEIPPGERQDLLEAIQSLASRVKYGFKLSQRVAMAFRAAMHLEKEYLDVLQTKEPSILLQNAIDDQCLNRLLVMSDIMTSMQMTANEIANFMAYQIARSIIKSRFYLFQSSTSHSFGQNFLWDYDLDKDFHLFLELCPSTSLLGHCLLKYCDALKVYRQFDSMKNIEPDWKTYANELRDIFKRLRDIMENQLLSHKKQNTLTVELLIKAHDCFVHECSMEGIAFVLQRCKVITSILASAKSWHLIVKLLMGVGRYRDMYYCFETLMKNDQFESLLGQFDEERANGLKDAIISYLREHHPNDKENYRLAALHFQMFHELAQISESEARMIIDSEIKHFEMQFNSNNSSSLASLNFSTNDTNFGTLNINASLNVALASGVTFLACSKSSIEALTSSMDAYAHASENYLLENKLGPAQKSASNAELVAMQIHLIRDALDTDKTCCICVLNIRNESTFRYLVNNELNIPQSLILSRTYPYEIIWRESIFNQYIMQGKDEYIIEYCVRMELTDEVIEHLVKNFLQSQTTVTAKMEKAISTTVEMSQSITLRYKLASLLSEKRIIDKLINGDCLYYLKDTNYGRTEAL